MYPNMVAEMSKKGITIEALAAILGVHRNTIANKITGDGAFTFEQAMTIAEAVFPEYKPSYIFKREKQTA